MRKVAAGDDQPTGRHPPRLLLEGPPRIGKSTLALRLVTRCLDAGLEVHGVTTDEMRTGGRRDGFEVVPVGGGPAALLAHVDLPGPPTVGRYGVDLPTFEAVALPLLQPPPRDGVVVVDELGAMELPAAGRARGTAACLTAGARSRSSRRCAGSR